MLRILTSGMLMSTTALAVTLPTVKITVATASENTGGGVEGIGRNDYAQGTVQVICGEATSCMSVFDDTKIEPQGPFAMEIRGRGHSTWAQAKKPFQLKLEDKEQFLGMPKDKKWILLNGHSDPSLVRNPLAFELGRQSSSLEFTPKGEFANVEIVNTEGDVFPQGVYYITQKVEDTGRRVDLDDKGYLLEWDTLKDGTHRLTSSEQYCTYVHYVWADEYCKFKDWDDDSTTADTCECEKEDANGDEITVACDEYQEDVKNDIVKPFDRNLCSSEKPTFFATDLTENNEYLNIKEPDLEKIIAKNDASVSEAIVKRIERFIKDFESKLSMSVTFRVNMDGEEVSANGVYVGGGMLGDAQAHQMTDDDGDGTYTVTVQLEPGANGNYIFLNGPGDGGDWNAKENLAEQDCADSANYNDRSLSVGSNGLVIDAIFGTCDDYTKTALTGEVQSWAAVEDMINVDSFVDWYLINEIAKNVDAAHYSSIYSNIKFSSDLDDDAVEFNACQESPNQCQINCAGGNDDKACQAMLKRCECASGKLAMGPLWDFDLGFGISSSSGYGENDPKYTEGFWVKNHRWISRLLSFPEFKAKVEARFSQYYNEKQETLNKIQAWGNALADGAAANAGKWPQVFDGGIWPGSPTMVYPFGSTDADITNNYAGAIVGLKAWYSNRLEWINDNINEL